ncbi:restriction endonuclease subunit S [Marnyiella aurantia]|uniref:Restriction endonuclease subunit S n=1 Tax=Marnyiella aurantia TaxID=2758037 RepID=A0A7D7QLB0_9FLAO|nr:restriction endonuclease subunit S [Marnyiella aurantia]MBA5245605.1 restriction endonuclease subunit S [Marnyiella aurantia]QMS98985.1 restriction endonuclease subunit S [Marnyiella aurantia]
MVKGMKQTEIGLIPEDWEVRELGEVGAVRMCKRIFQHQTVEYGEIPFFKIGTFGKEPDAFISRKLFEEFKTKFSYPKVGDILISAAGTIGRTVVYDGEERYYQDSNIVWIDNEEHIISNHLLKYVLDIVSYNTEGGTIQRLYNNILRSTKFVCPPLPEQEAIAGALSDADAWIESLEQLIAKKRMIKQGAMQELLTPKEGWEVKKLGEVFKLKQGVQCGVEKQFKNHSKGLVRFIRIVDVTQSNTEARFISDPGIEHRLNFNDLFMVRYGAPGVVGFNYEGVIANNLFRLIPKREIVNSYFKYLFDFMKPTLEEISSSSTMAALNFTTLNNVDLSFPSLIEQTRIATILSDMDADLAALEQQLHKARQIKQGMMQELLTGRVRLV